MFFFLKHDKTFTRIRCNIPFSDHFLYIYYTKARGGVPLIFYTDVCRTARRRSPTVYLGFRGTQSKTNKNQSAQRTSHQQYRVLLLLLLLLAAIKYTAARHSIRAFLKRLCLYGSVSDGPTYTGYLNCILSVTCFDSLASK